MPLKKEITEKENVLLTAAGKKPAWVPFVGDAFGSFMSEFVGGKMNPDTKIRTDIWGVARTVTEDGPIPMNTKTRNFELPDVTKWKDFIPDINLDALDWEKDTEKFRNDPKNEGRIIEVSVTGSWEWAHLCMGFENALLQLLTEPEAMFDAFNAAADFHIKILKNITRYIKPDVVHITDHMANTKNLLMSPASYREIIKPVQKRIVDEAKNLGAIPMLHVDGYFEDIIPDVAEIGFKALRPFQVMNDINFYKEKYDLLCVGGWNTHGRGNQSDSTEEECRESVRLAIDTYAPTYRYVFFPGGVSPRFAARNGAWINDEARKYCLTFYDNR